MRTRRLSLLAALVAAVAALTMTANPQGVRAADVTVSMGDSFFAPSSITVQVGDTITWANGGALPHTTTAVDAWDSDILMAGEQFSYTFATAGTFNYLCAVHPTIMTGTVVVEQASSGPAPTVTLAPVAGQPTAGNPSGGQDLPSAGTGPGPQGDGAGVQWAMIVGVAAAALATLGGAVMMLQSRRKR